MKFLLNRGFGLYEKKVSVLVFGAPYYVLCFKTLGLFSHETITLPLNNIINIQYIEEKNYSPAKASLYAWLTSFISYRSALFGAAWGLRKKVRGIIAITIIDGHFTEEIIISAGKTKSAYEKYSRLIQMFNEV